MATFTVRQGKRYRANLSLGLLERLASNEMIADQVRSAGFADVTVSGTGAQRVAEALWPSADVTAEMPSQIIAVSEI
jgi:transketolase N-terminal domain/subunit